MPSVLWRLEFKLQLHEGQYLQPTFSVLSITLWMGKPDVRHQSVQIQLNIVLQVVFTFCEGTQKDNTELNGSYQTCMNVDLLLSFTTTYKKNLAVYI
jgi:hypothetical protein